MSSELRDDIRSHVKKTLELAIPIAFGNLSHILLGLIDTVMVGRLGIDALAAISFAGALFGFLIIVSVGMTSAIGPIVAKERGAGSKKGCGAVLVHHLVVNFVFALLLWAVLAVLTHNLHWFGQPTNLLPDARDYLLIVAPTILAVVLMNTYRQYSEALGNAVPMIYFLFGSLLLNVFLNWVWIFGNLGFAAMGLSGAALATLVSRGVTCLALMVYVHSSSFFVPFWTRLNSISWSSNKFREHLSLGLAASLQYSAEASAFTGAAVIMGWIGTVALAAHQIAINLASMTFMFALGVSVAAGIRVGEAYGARKIGEARRAGFVSIGLACCFMGVAGLGFYFFRNELPMLYLKDVEVIGLASKLLVVAAVFQLFDGVQAVALGALRGMMDARWPTMTTILAYWVFALPVAYLLAIKMEWGAVGVWVALLVGLAISSILLSARFYRLTDLRALNINKSND